MEMKALLSFNEIILSVTKIQWLNVIFYLYTTIPMSMLKFEVNLKILQMDFVVAARNNFRSI
jgi:hypothetical protein